MEGWAGRLWSKKNFGGRVCAWQAAEEGRRNNPKRKNKLKGTERRDEIKVVAFFFFPNTLARERGITTRVGIWRRMKQKCNRSRGAPGDDAEEGDAGLACESVVRLSC